MGQPKGSAGTTAGLGERTTSGFVALAGQTIATKVVNFTGQIVLANLLVPADYDLFALALTVMMFAALLQRGGIREVLIHRGDAIGEWVNVAFWMSLASGLVVGGLAAATSPLVAHFFGRQRLVSLLCVLAAAAPLNAVAAVPMAMLEADFRFRLIAVLEWCLTAASLVSTILLALGGTGVWSLVIPIPAFAAIRAVTYTALARPRLQPKPELRRWRHFMTSNLQALGGHAALTATYQGDYIALGRYQDSVAVGRYYFAFVLSTQTIQLFTINLSNVLLPTFTRMGEEGSRRTRALWRTTAVLGMAGMPLLLLQAALAEPLARAFFPPRWYGVIPLVQVLSVGMIGRLYAGVSQSLLLAQGRFRAYGWASVGYAAVFLPTVWLTARYFGVEITAVAVSALMLVNGPVQLAVAARDNWRAVVGSYRALVAAGPAIGLAVLASHLIPATGRIEYASRGLLVLAVGLLLYLPIVKFVDPVGWREMGSLLSVLRRRFWPVSAAA